MIESSNSNYIKEVNIEKEPDIYQSLEIKNNELAHKNNNQSNLKI